MIVWQGLGFLVVAFVVIAFVGVQYALNAIFGTGFYADTAWAKVLAGVLAAVFIALVGCKLNNKEGKIVIDPETNQKIRLVEKHTLFWIPMQYWAPVSIVISVYLAYFAE